MSADEAGFFQLEELYSFHLLAVTVSTAVKIQACFCVWLGVFLMLFNAMGLVFL